MKIDFNFTPTSLETGEPMHMGDAAATPATLARLCVQALGTMTADDKDMTAEEKVRAYTIGGKIVKGGVVNLTVEEIALLKKRVGGFPLYGPFVVGPCLEALERDASHLANLETAAKETANG